MASATAGYLALGHLLIEIALIDLRSWAQAVWLPVGLLMIGLAALPWQAESQAATVSGRPQPA